MQYTYAKAVCVYGISLYVVSPKNMAMFDIELFLFFPSLWKAPGLSFSGDN